MNHTTFYSFGRALAGSLVLHAIFLIWGAQLLATLPKHTRPPETTLSVRLAEPPGVQPPAAVPEPQPELRMREDNPPAAAPTVKRKAKPAVRPAKKPASAALKKVLTRPPAPDRSPAPARAPGDTQELTGAAARVAREQIARELFYPPEAIERGLEGEVLVMLFLDAAGNVIAARIEASSGHPILDQAAVRAARTLHSLPASAPREALVPVRFRLR